MARPKSKTRPKLLTEVELELMTALWQLEEGTVRDVIAHLRENVERYADFVIQYVYALGPAGELLGVVPLRELLLARPERSVVSLMIAKPISVDVDTPLDPLVELFDHYDFLGGGAAAG